MGTSFHFLRGAENAADELSFTAGNDVAARQSSFSGDNWRIPPAKFYPHDLCWVIGGICGFSLSPATAIKPLLRAYTKCWWPVLIDKMAYIYRLMPQDAVEPEREAALLETVLEIDGPRPDILVVKEKLSGGVSPAELSEVERVPDWRDRPVHERTSIYWREGKRASGFLTLHTGSSPPSTQPCSF